MRACGRRKGEILLDAEACFIKGAHPGFSDEQYTDENGDCFRVIFIVGKRGYFKVKSYSTEEESFFSTTFYINEAKDEDKTKPNIKWTVINEIGKPPMLGWLITKDIEKDEELLAKYKS
jgi:hypothetical protein